MFHCQWRRGTVPIFLQTWQKKKKKKLQSSSFSLAGDVPRMFSLIKNSFCVRRDEEREKNEEREERKRR